MSHSSAYFLVWWCGATGVLLLAFLERQEFSLNYWRMGYLNSAESWKLSPCGFRRVGHLLVSLVKLGCIPPLFLGWLMRLHHWRFVSQLKSDLKGIHFLSWDVWETNFGRGARIRNDDTEHKHESWSASMNSTPSGQKPLCNDAHQSQLAQAYLKPKVM